MPDMNGGRGSLMFVPTLVSTDATRATPIEPHFPATEQHTPNGFHCHREQFPANHGLHIDKLRVVDALTARDVAVYRLQGACASVRAKEAIIEKLEREKEELKMNLELAGKGKDGVSETFLEQRKKLTEKIAGLETANKELKTEVEMLKIRQDNQTVSTLNTPRFNEIAEQTLKGFPFAGEESDSLNNGAKSPVTSSSSTTPLPGQRDGAQSPAEDRREARHAILSSLPIPSNMPTDILVPIIIPPPFSIHDFLGTVQGDLKNQLVNYRVFQECITSWCPEREEHGYFMTPAFKCMTNPRVSAAHRWIPVDIAAKCSRPMECFYNKEGKWYYAGLYKAFKLDDVSPEEWTKLPNETHQALIKETLSARKNTSPQNIYETSQLYVAGALKTTCIGLQCIGFSEDLYKGLLEQAEVCARTGRWRGMVVAGPVAGLLPPPSPLAAVNNTPTNSDNTGGGTPAGGTPGPAIGTAVGAAWNVAVNLVANGSLSNGGGILKIRSSASDQGSSKEEGVKVV